jgi:hypothetical protein
MPKLTFEQEAAYALNYGISRDDISRGAQIIYDRLKDERDARPPGQPGAAPVPPVPARSSPETRARILQMFKRGNRKYALPFEGNRLALASFAGGNWEEYGQIILQMAILDTLLSIEEKLSSPGAP